MRKRIGHREPIYANIICTIFLRTHVRIQTMSGKQGWMRKSGSNRERRGAFKIFFFFFLHSVSRPTPDANIFTYTWKEGLTVMNSYSHIVTTTAWYIEGANVSYLLAAFSHPLVQLKYKCNRHFLALQAFSFYVVLFCLWIFFVLKSKKIKTSTLMT